MGLYGVWHAALKAVKWCLGFSYKHYGPSCRGLRKRERMFALSTILWGFLFAQPLATQSVSGETAVYRGDYVTAQSKNLPFPTEIELKVEFWKAIYTRYNTDQGVIHDSEDLSVIYDAVQLPKSNEMGAVDRVRYEIRDMIFSILRKQGLNLTSAERALLAKFPAGVSRARLMRATENIRFQRGQANRFKEGIIRSGYYLKHIEEILKEEGVPDFVKFLPHVESSFQEYAMSKFAAAGLWQLMPATGRMFLRVEYVIDERLDPWIATRAAARHLKRDFNYLGAWPLAITAYNHGPGGVMQAVKALGTTDIAEIAFKYESPSFGFASRNFYCQFLAAVEVASNYKRYFGELPLKPTIQFELAKIDRPTFFSELGKKYDFNLDEFKRLNPGLRPPILQNLRPIPVGLTIRVPVGSQRQVLVASLDKSIGRSAALMPRAEKAMSDLRVPELTAPKKTAKVAGKKPVESRYAVKDLADNKGWIQVEINETISHISEWLGVPVEEVRLWNGMEEFGQIEQGQKLLLKFSPSVSAASFQSAREDYHQQIREDFFARYQVTKTQDYVVKRGENLWSLCYQKFDIPAWLLQETNPKVNLSTLSGGTKIKIPVVIEKDFDSVSSNGDVSLIRD